VRGTDLLLDVAGKFSAMENGTMKTALAMQLFGRSGATLIPFGPESFDVDLPNPILHRRRRNENILVATWIACRTGNA
jgi:hypothetical protein